MEMVLIMQTREYCVVTGQLGRTCLSINTYFISPAIGRYDE